MTKGPADSTADDRAGGVRSTPVCFVYPEMRRHPELGDETARDEAARLLPTLATGREVWILGTYLRLLQRGYPVRLVADFPPGALCVAHHDDARRRTHRLWRSFVVAVRADRSRTFTCDLEIVQSPASIEAADAFYVPHWPQPGLRPRDPARGTRVEQLGYFGLLKNLAAAFRSDEFRAALAALGVRLVVRDDPAEWADYSDIDVVLAVRDGSPQFLAGKPASKLFNAWHAGCPALVGDEPAFRHYRRSAFDYVHVRSADDVLRQIERMRDPQIYAPFVERANARAREIDEDHVAGEWIAFLDDVAQPRYLAWRERNPAIRSASAVTRHAFGVLRHLLRGKQHARGFDLDGRPIRPGRSRVREAASALDRWLTRREQAARHRLTGSAPARPAARRARSGSPLRSGRPRRR